MVKQHISILANSDLSYDRRLQRIAGSLRLDGYSVNMTGRCFQGKMPERKEGEIHLRLWSKRGKLAYLELNIRLFSRMLWQKTDAICSADLDTLPAAWLAAKLKGCKLVQDSHEYMAEVPEVSGRAGTQAMWHRIAEWFLPGCHLRYTTSQSLVEAFRIRYASAFSLIRNMPLLQEEIPAKPMPENFPHRDFLVYLGAVNQGRGLEEIIEVLSQREEILVIVGEGDKSNEIKKLIDRFQMQNRVFLTGKLLPEELPYVLKHARAGLNLLRDEGLSYRYSLANKFFDYVHAGIPQICIDFPEYKSLTQEYGVGLICSLETESIHSALDAMKDPLLQENFRKEALKARQQWNWQKEEKTLLELYRRMFAK